MKLGRTMLWCGWALTLVLALACLAILGRGLLRDTRWGEPAIPLDLSQPSGWRSQSFRVWGEDTYRLFISSVNHDPRYVGRHLLGDFEVRISGNDGRVLFSKLYRGENLEHKVPDGYTDTALAEVRVKGRPWQTGSLAVRVTEPDPAFQTTRSALKLWKERADVGMGGLVNYAMFLPGAVLLLLSLVFAVLLARKGHRWPLVATIVVLALFLLLFVG